MMTEFQLAQNGVLMKLLRVSLFFVFRFTFYILADGQMSMFIWVRGMDKSCYYKIVCIVLHHFLATVTLHTPTFKSTNDHLITVCF